MNIATVVEGPTDHKVLEAVLNGLLPGEHRYLVLQPSTPLGRTDAGWKGVRRWCRETWQRQGSSLDKILAGDTGPALDLLVIHVDADIAAEHDLQKDGDNPIPDVAQPCPPIEPTTKQLRRVIGRWLQRDLLPSKVILAIPAQDTESWTFAALFPGDDLCTQSDYECTKTGRGHPGYHLTLKKYGKPLQRKDGKIKKTGQAYRLLARQIAGDWDTVCRVCSQAQRFTDEVQSSMPEKVERRVRA